MSGHGATVLLLLLVASAHALRAPRLPGFLRRADNSKDNGGGAQAEAASPQQSRAVRLLEEAAAAELAAEQLEQQALELKQQAARMSPPAEQLSQPPPPPPPPPPSQPTGEQPTSREQASPQWQAAQRAEDEQLAQPLMPLEQLLEQRQELRGGTDAEDEDGAPRQELRGGTDAEDEDGAPSLSEEEALASEIRLLMQASTDDLYLFYMSCLPNDRYPLPTNLLDAADEAALRERVFGSESFVVRTIEKTQAGTVIRGNLRCDAATASARVQSSLEAEASLRDRVRLFLLYDPVSPGPLEPDETEWEDAALADMIAGENPFEPEPIFLALPADLAPAAGTDRRLAAAAPIAAFSATTAAVVLWAAQAFAGSSNVAPDGTFDLAVAEPLIQATLLLQLAHEAGHGLVGMLYGLRARPSLFIPSAALGCTGGHAPLASYPPNRTSLFDFALAGPLVGGGASLALFLAGLALTSGAPEAALPAFPRIATPILHGSLFASLAVEAALGEAAAAADSTAVALHPLALAGFTGLVANALAILPIGRLDGGRAATAAFGRKPAAALGGLTLFVLGCTVLLTDSPEVLSLWACTAFLLFRQAEVPCVDEVTPVDDRRVSLLLPLFLLALTVVMPAPVSGGPDPVFEQLSFAAAQPELWSK